MNVHLIVPCKDEARRLPTDALVQAVDRWPWLRLLLVDDGSTDATPDLLADLAAQRPEPIQVLTLPRNLGKGEAVRAGLRQAVAHGAQTVGYWDADLATPLDELPAFRDALLGDPQLEGVLGARIKMLGRPVERNRWRHWFGRIAATFASEWLSLPVYDTQCGAKLFRVTPSLHALLSEPFLSRWAFDVELLVRWRRLNPAVDDDALGQRWVELPLRAWRDVPGSKITLTDFLVTPWVLLRIRWATRASGPLIGRLRANLQGSQGASGAGSERPQDPRSA